MPHDSRTFASERLYSLPGLLELRRQLLRFARSLPPGPERNDRRQTADSLRRLFRNDAWLEAHTVEQQGGCPDSTKEHLLKRFIHNENLKLWRGQLSETIDLKKRAVLLNLIAKEDISWEDEIAPQAKAKLAARRELSQKAAHLIGTLSSINMTVDCGTNG